MIIPIKCVSCGMVLADKYRYYKNKVIQEKTAQNDFSDEKYLTLTNTEKTVEGKLLDELKIKKMCCRRHMLTHVDID
jgi:DNA-directed RNA polymerases I, II, and III subunit RPABC5